MEFKNKMIATVFSAMMVTSTLFGGNEDRAGSAGASELLINPWTRSSGWGGAGSSFYRGLEAVQFNVAGLAGVDKTEVIFSRTNWLVGSGININAFGIAQKVGSQGVMSLGFNSFGFGEIDITTTEQPEGGLGTFRPQTFVFNLAYAHAFTSRISGGINFKVLNTGISDLRTSGVAIDAGVNYVAENEKTRIGIALKNVGPAMTFAGDGMSVTTTNSFTGLESTTEERSARFELPSLLMIGVSHDINIGENPLTLAGTFVANSFTQDQYSVGGEYGISANKIDFKIRAGVTLERAVFSKEDRLTALTGPAAGLTVDFPFGKNNSSVGVDYSYRATSSQFSGVHSVGIRINLASAEE